MADSGASIPGPVLDFVREFYAAVRVNRVFEVQALYERGWRDMSKRYYPNGPWPAASDITDAVKGDRTFLVLYKLLYFRHLLSKGAAGGDRSSLLHHHVNAWAAYVDFFELVLDGARVAELELPASWVFETLGQDLLFYFQQFHELRAAPEGAAPARVQADGEDEGGIETDDDRLAALRFNAALVDPASGSGAPDDVTLSSVWTLRAVLTFLHRIADAAASSSDNGSTSTLSSSAPAGTRMLAAYFARLALTRLYVKLGDYATALSCARPLGVLAGDGAYTRLAKAHVSLAYYAGFALLMARRFDDALRVFSRTIMFFHRTGRVLDDEATRESRGAPPLGGLAAFIKKTCDKMLALLAVASVVLPGAPVDEPVRRAMRDRFGDKMDRIAAGGGDGDVEDVFTFACPGFLPSDTATASLVTAPRAQFEAHLRLFRAEVAQRAAGLGPLRSYLRLYTTLDVSRLAEYARTDVPEARAMLTTLKIKALQTGPGLSAVGSSSQAVPSGSEAAAAAVASAASSDPLHFFLTGDTITVDETRPTPNAAGFFVRQIEALAKIVAVNSSSSSNGGAQATSSAQHWGGGGRRGGGGGGGGGYGRQQSASQQAQR